MWIIPYKSESYLTSLNGEQLKRVFVENVEPYSLFVTDKTKPFFGHFRNNRFELTRSVKYSNAFMPLVSGIIVQDNNIQIVYRLSTTTILFTSIIICGFTWMLYDSLISGYLIGTRIIALVFIVGLVLTGFWAEFRKTKEQVVHTLKLTRK